MKPLGHKAYGSIPHMPGSKRGPGDHGIEEQQAAIIDASKRPRDVRVWVQEKWDGCCMSVAKIDGRIVALGRAGYLAESSPYEHMRRFPAWVREREHRFARLLAEGERVVGEWMLMASGFVYEVHDPDALFLAFDIMRGHERATADLVEMRCHDARIDSVPTVKKVDALSEQRLVGMRRSIQPLAEREGVVYRVERFERSEWRHSFCAKWVRRDFEAGALLSDETRPITWNRLTWLSRSEAA